MRADILSDLLVGLNMEVTEKNQNKINFKKIQKNKEGETEGATRGGSDTDVGREARALVASGACSVSLSRSDVARAMGLRGERDTDDESVASRSSSASRVGTLKRRSQRTIDRDEACTAASSMAKQSRLSRSEEDVACTAAQSVSERPRHLPSDRSEDPEWEPGATGPARKRPPRDTLPKKEELSAFLRGQATADLAAEAYEDLKRVQEIAATSNNLKGQFVRELRLNSRRTEVRIAELVQRCAMQSGPALAEEMCAALRERNRKLEEELAALRRGASAAAVPSPAAVAPPPIPARVPGARGESAGAGRPDVQEDIVSRLASALEARLDARFAELRRELVLGIGPLMVGGAPPPPPMVCRSAARPPPAPVPPNPAPQAAGGSANEKKKKGKKKKGPTTQPLPDHSRGPSTSPAEAGLNRPPVIASQAQQPPAQAEIAWTKVLGRKAKQAAVAAPAAPSKKKALPHRQGAVKPPPGRAPLPPREPKVAAVTLTVEEGATLTYAEVMLRAKSGIRLSDLGITSVRVKRAITGGIVMEVPGEASAARADALAAKLRETLAGMGVRVARPCKQAEIRLYGLDDSVTSAEVAAAVATASGCAAEAVATGDVRMSPGGLGTAWVRCPTGVARRLAVEGRVVVGWAEAKVQPLRPRPLQCFRCLEPGHVRGRCKSAVDRSGRCFRCGSEDHIARACTAALKCPLCSDLGRPAAHRLGGGACVPPGKLQRPGASGPPASRPATEVAAPRPPPRVVEAGPSVEATVPAPPPAGEAPETEKSARPEVDLEELPAAQ